MLQERTEPEIELFVRLKGLISYYRHVQIDFLGFRELNAYILAGQFYFRNTLKELLS
jgi:hypothetical protein